MSHADYSGTTEVVSISSTTTGADATLVYTCPASHDAEVVFLTATNGSASHTINILFYHAETSDWHYITRAHTIAGGTTYDVLNSSSLYLHAGDKIACYKSAGTLDVTLSAKQYFNPTRT